MGSDSQFCGPKPCLALPTTIAKSKIKNWFTQSHYQNWKTNPGCKQSKRWLIQPSRQTALYFLGLKNSAANGSVLDYWPLQAEWPSQQAEIALGSNM
jgi:hypothetical protein